MVRFGVDMVERGMSTYRPPGMLRRARAQRLGPSVAPGQHPLSFVDPPPRIRPFVIESPEFVVRPNGIPIILLSGTCPSLADLDGFVLVATSRRRQLVFGGMHPKIRDGADAPFMFFFELNGANAEIHGMLEAVMHVDVAVSGADGTIVPLVFRFFRWDELMSPGGRYAGYHRVVAEGGESD